MANYIKLVSDKLVFSDSEQTDKDLDSLVKGEGIGTTTLTLTNKRITKRVGTATSTATLTIDSDSYDEYYITAQAEALEIAAPTGTPTSGQTLLIGIKDDGTTRALTWNAAFVVIGTTLPTNTTAGKNHIIGCKWNAANSKWWVLAVSVEV
jgi:hypothetical protein